jgi:hypothetical protein
MQAPRTRSAAAFQVAAAVDDYLSRLHELRDLHPDQCASRLGELTEAMRAVRIRCAGTSTLHAAVVELLIGHAELTYRLSLTRGRLGSRRMQDVLSAQEARAENLLRLGIEPLVAEA